jgi:hypothetical protein
MPAFDITQRYSLKIEYLLTWYPIGETPNLDGPKMYGNVVERSSANFGNPGLGGGTYESVGVGGGWTRPKPFDSAEKVWANIEFGVPAKTFLPTFEATCQRPNRPCESDTEIRPAARHHDTDHAQRARQDRRTAVD